MFTLALMGNLQSFEIDLELIRHDQDLDFSENRFRLGLEVLTLDRPSHDNRDLILCKMSYKVLDGKS